LRIAQIEAVRKKGSSMAPPKTQPDPSTFKAYSHAAAGHDGVRSDSSGALLIKPCTPSEVSFYGSAADHPAFQAYMPTFMGTLALNENNELSLATNSAPVISNDPLKEDAMSWVPSGGKKLDTGLSIVLENVTAGFKRPNVIDLKLGARLWDDKAPEAKRRKLDEVSDATTSGSLGFRIAGMKVHRPDRKAKPDGRFQEHIEIEDDGYWSYNKQYGRAFSAETVHEAFVEFFGGEETLKKSGRRLEVVKRLANEVKKLALVLEREESRMYSASILMVHEGDTDAMDAALEEEKRRAANGDDDEHGDDSGEDDEEQKPKVSDMRLIDFAHAEWTPGQGADENALQGVRSALKILDQLVTEGKLPTRE
jgi:inositol-polyphosphate multikinase